MWWVDPATQKETYGTKSVHLMQSTAINEPSYTAASTMGDITNHPDYYDQGYVEETEPPAPVVLEEGSETDYHLDPGSPKSMIYITVGAGIVLLGIGTFCMVVRWTRHKQVMKNGYGWKYQQPDEAIRAVQDPSFIQEEPRVRSNAMPPSHFAMSE